MKSNSYEYLDLFEYRNCFNSVEDLENKVIDLSEFKNYELRLSVYLYIERNILDENFSLKYLIKLIKVIIRVGKFLTRINAKTVLDLEYTRINSIYSENLTNNKIKINGTYFYLDTKFIKSFYNYEYYNLMFEYNMIAKDLRTNDYWDLLKIERYRIEHENGYKQVVSLDFSLCKSEDVKFQLKDYYINIIDFKKISLAQLNIERFGLQKIIEFINSRNINSLSNLYMNYIIEDFRSFLKSKLFKTKTTSHYLTQKYEIKTIENDINSIILFKKIIRYINLEIEEIPEHLKDIWEISKMDFELPKQAPNADRFCHFTLIHQPKLKHSIKLFSYHRLKLNQIGTVNRDIASFRTLSKYLYTNYPEVSYFSDITKEIINKYYLYMNDRYSESSRSKAFTSIKNYITYAHLYNFDDKPDLSLVDDFMISRKDIVNPTIFTDDELYQLNKNVRDLPLNIARMLYLYQNIGLRPNEVATLKCDCLIVNSDGESVLEYRNHKKLRVHRKPITELDAEILSNAIVDSKNEFGDSSEFIFPRDANKPITMDIFYWHIRKYVVRNNILDLNGNFLKITAHKFRRTLASQLAEQGIDFLTISYLLNHMDYDILKYYVRTSSKRINDAIDPYIEKINNKIKNDFNQDIRVNELEGSVVLENGSCYKPLKNGKCEHGNACYECTLHRGNKEFIAIYLKQKNVAYANMKIAERNGLSLQYKANEIVYKKMIKILNKLGEGNG